MIHAGDPISYANLNTSYWQSHFYAYGRYHDWRYSMAASKSQKIQAEIEKVKAKINEQQARLKELEKNKLEAENSEIVDIVRGLSISLEELPWCFSSSGRVTSGQSVQKSGPMEKEEN